MIGASLIAAAAAGVGAGAAPPNAFPSMIFFENGTLNGTAAYTEAQLHADEVAEMSQFALAIAGWGADASTPPASMHEEEKLANISRLIKAASPGTMTAVYAGQFELVVPTYDHQRRIIQDPAYSGFFMKYDPCPFPAPTPLDPLTEGRRGAGTTTASSCRPTRPTP